MTETNQTAYEDLMKHLEGWIFGVPNTNSPHLKKMFEMRFTPEEAKFLTKIPFLPHTAEQLSSKIGINIEEITEKLDSFSKRGIIFRVVGRSATRYSFRSLLFWLYRMPGWLGIDDDWNRKLAPHLNQYYIENFAERFIGHPERPLRTLPINQTVKDPKTILPYEDILKVIDNIKYFTVSTCACKHRHNLDSDFDECKHDLHVCLHFDRLGKYCVENGLGKEITKEETLDILKRAADAGLVHGLSNSENGYDTICNCCQCCCLFLEKASKLPDGILHGTSSSNYIREIEEDKCIACGLCVKRCPMDAIELKDKKITFTPELCIGCGVCVHKCPKDAIFLVKRDEEQKFPKDERELTFRLLKERKLDPSKVFENNSIK